MAIEVVVFVPGICGSVLRDGDDVLWPGTPADAVFKTYPERLLERLANSTSVAATDVLRDVPLQAFGITVHHVDGYGRALKSLEGMGFSESGGTLIPFSYDWREDIRKSADKLSRRLAGPDLKGRSIGIVAHSMGGLVARYALEKLGGCTQANVELCALIATPHLGAPAVLQNILGLRPEIFLSAKQCRTVLGNPAFPSAYQLLPRAGIPALLRPSVQRGFVVQDLFDVRASNPLGIEAESLVPAKALADELPVMVPGFQTPCQYVAIAGNAQKTITANYLWGSADLTAKVEEATAGDGTVPLWSAAPPGIPVRYVAATHGGMFRDRDTEELLRSVLKPGTPGARLFANEPLQGAPKLSVQALQTSVMEGQSVRIAVVADREITTLNTAVVVDMVTEGGRTTHAEVPLRYEGGSVRSIPADFAAPTEPAVLLIELRGNGDTEASVLVLPNDM